MGIRVDRIFRWPAHLLALYSVYWQVEPWGTFADDVRTGFITSTVANTVSRKAVTVADCKPKWWSPFVDPILAGMATFQKVARRT